MGGTKNGKKIDKIIQNQYGNLSGTFYYLEGLFQYFKNHGAKVNEQEVCLRTFNMKIGRVRVEIEVDIF